MGSILHSPHAALERYKSPFLPIFLIPVFISDSLSVPNCLLTDRGGKVRAQLQAISLRMSLQQLFLKVASSHRIAS